MDQIVECVPNFSVGNNDRVVQKIVAAASSVAGEYVLHVDSGVAANRTVVTFAGTPDAVVEAAFRAVQSAAEYVDMRCHRGEHPRIGATDVLPLVPVRGVTLEQCAGMARRLAERVGMDLGIPVYCYEAAASEPARRGLEACRRGEYEGLKAKLEDPAWRPDFGPSVWNETVARSGASVIGARNFLGAVNFNLASSGDRAADVAVARAVAREIRAAAHGPWSLAGVKAIGWWIDEYGFAQVSTNLTDMHVTGLDQAFEVVAERAAQYGRRVIGTEVIGLLPEWVLVEAGCRLVGQTLDPVSAIAVAIERLGLDTMRAQGRIFDPEEKIVERVLAAKMATYAGR